MIRLLRDHGRRLERVNRFQFELEGADQIVSQALPVVPVEADYDAKFIED